MPARRGAGVSGALLLGLVVLGGCTGDGVDRDDAVQDLLATPGVEMTDEQARCYVDRVLDEVGADGLDGQDRLAPDEQARLVVIRVDCIGVANLGRAFEQPSVGPLGTFSGGNHPRERGDDPALDALWDRCEAGFGASCDELFDAAAPGTGYEGFALSCGGRTRELRCADVYPEPGVSLPSPAQVSTTVPPAAP